MRHPRIFLGDSSPREARKCRLRRRHKKQNCYVLVIVRTKDRPDRMALVCVYCGDRQY